MFGYFDMHVTVEVDVNQSTVDCWPYQFQPRSTADVTPACAVLLVAGIFITISLVLVSHTMNWHLQDFDHIFSQSYSW